MASAKRTRKRYSARRRQEIIAVANREGLTATDVQHRFGVIPVTYYSWRKKVAEDVRRANPKPPVRRRNGIEQRARDAVRSRLAKQIPRIVQEEVDRILDSMLGDGRRKRRRVEKHERRHHLESRIRARKNFFHRRGRARTIQSEFRLGRYWRSEHPKRCHRRRGYLLFT